MKKQNNKDITEGIRIVNTVLDYYIGRFGLRGFMSVEDIEDMRQEGMVEMLHYYKHKYDPTRAQFNTILVPRIKGFFIDYLQKQGCLRKITCEHAIDLVSEEIENVFQSSVDETTAIVDRLHLMSGDIQEIVVSLSDDELMNDIKFSLLALPEIKLKIILSYYLFNKSIKEISKELNYDEDSGWVYKMKKQAINKIKQQLKHKGFHIS